MIKKIYYILLLFAACTLHAQHPVYIQFSEKNDLPDIEFYSIIEDAKGFIWLAADKGFYRYDGNKFKIFTNKEKRGLSIFDPKEDSKGRVWCCNISGQFFYVENEELVTFIDLGKETQWQLGDFIVTETHLLVFSDKTIYKIALDTKQIEDRISLTDAYLGSPFVKGDQIYITAGDRIVALDKNLKITKQIASEAIYNDLVNVSQGRSIGISIEGKTYLKYKNAEFESLFFEFDINTGAYQEVNLPKELLSNQLIQIKYYKGEVFFSTSSGIWVFAYDDGKFTYKNRYFKDEFVSKLIIDKNENYWATTIGNGVFVIPNTNINDYNLPSDISQISSIEKINDHQFFFGTMTGKAGIYDVNQHTIEPVKLKGKGKVSSLVYNPKTSLIYISQSAQARILNLRTKKTVENDRFINARSLSLMQGDSIFYTNYRGAELVNGEESIFFPRKNLGRIRAYMGFYDAETKNSYVSYVDNLIRFDEKLQSKNIRFKEKPIHAVGIAKTDNGFIWVSTFKDGLFGIKNDRVVVHYNTENGLISNLTQKIQGDGNSLWIVTDKGIQFLNTETQTFQTLTKRDGINTYLINGIVPLKDNIIFSSVKGIFSIDRAKVFKNSKKPEIYFTGIQVNEKDTLIQEKISLPHSQNAIKISFNSNGFKSKQNMKYQSRLLGFNDSWIPVSEGANFVKYNSLPVGNYTFQVKGTSISSNKNSAIAAIKIAIKSPFWQKSWFIISAVLVSLLLIILYYKIILKKRDKQKNIELEKLAQERELVFLKLENLRSQMNPHFIFNALNSIQEFIILSKKNLASDYLGKFADLIRTYLNHSNKGEISLRDEINCLKMYLELEELRFEDKLVYSVDIDESINTKTLMIPTMLIQPYVENALKHGLLHRKENRVLTIVLKKSDTKNTIICEVTDNGVGRAKALELNQRKNKTQKPFSAKVIEDRLVLLNYGREKHIGISIEDLYDNKINASAGTKVIITIPMEKRNHKYTIHDKKI
ncbi:MAG: histidine kinase [Kordia sp.]|uniref:sensor histidine kinase n=1 Tax=Kordia sp. TaxID=1965332 RepID=UPI00385D71A8